jgi:hypothetical protein
MKSNRLVQEPPDSKVASANSFEEIRESLGRDSSSMFGR